MLWPVKAIEKYLPETKRVSKRFIATLTAYIISIIVFVVIVLLMVQPVSRQLIELTQALPRYIVELEEKSIEYIDDMSSQYGISVFQNLIKHSGISNLPDDLSKLSTEDQKKVQAAAIEENIYKQLQALANQGAQALQGIALGTFRNIIYGILILMLTFFFLISAQDIRSWLNSIAQKQNFIKLPAIENRIHEAMLGYIRGQAVIGFLTGLFMWVIYTIFDLKYALVLALFMGFGQFIPFIGQTLAIIPAIIVALVQDPLTAMVVFIIFLIFQVFSNNVLVPKILGDMTGLNPIVVIIALIIGERTAGVIGILLAVPVASIIKILIDYIYSNGSEARSEAVEEPPPAIDSAT